MDIHDFDRITPFVRTLRTRQDLSLVGKWQDFDHVFTLITAGKADFIIDGVSHSVSKGDVVVISPYQTHVICSENGQMFEQEIFHFDFYRTAERSRLQSEDVLNCEGPKVVPEAEKLLGGQVYITSLDDPTFYIFVEIFKLMLEEYQRISEGTGSQSLLSAYATQMIIMALRNGHPVIINKDSDDRTRSKSWLHIENALDYINHHYMEEDLSNERISGAIGVSPNYLTKRFHASFGMPLHRYLVRLRIEKAQSLLNTGVCNVTEAASATGFSSIHVFSKTFRAVTGMSPSTYLENIADEKTTQRKYLDRNNT